MFVRNEATRAILCSGLLAARKQAPSFSFALKQIACELQRVIRSLKEKNWELQRMFRKVQRMFRELKQMISDFQWLTC